MRIKKALLVTCDIPPYFFQHAYIGSDKYEEAKRDVRKALEKLNEIHQQKFNKELMINYQEYLVPYSSVNDKILQYFVESGGEEWDNDTYAILIDELN